MRSPVGIVACAAVLLAVVALAVAWRSPDPGGRDLAEVAAAGEDASAGPLAELRAQLELERAERKRLEDRVRALDARVASLDAPPLASPSDAPNEAGVVDVVEAAPRGEAGATGPATGPGRGSFDEAALLSAGLLPSEVRWLRERWEQSQLATLYLNDRAMREGWGFRRTRQARIQQRQAFLDEVGADMYDHMLYATGSPNRVVVGDVYEGSAAEAAGLRPGDAILSYAGAPVFTPRDLRWLSAGGEAGAPVALDVQRGGRLLTLRIERGPLGISSEPQRVQPELPR